MRAGNKKGKATKRVRNLRLKNQRTAGWRIAGEESGESGARDWRAGDKQNKVIERKSIFCTFDRGVDS